MGYFDTPTGTEYIAAQRAEARLSPRANSGANSTASANSGAKPASRAPARATLSAIHEPTAHLVDPEYLQRMRDNEALPCKATGCTRNRRHFGSLCNTHLHTKHAYGSPYSRIWHAKDLKQARRLARKLYRRHQDHPGIVRAVEYFEEQLATGIARRASVGEAACTPENLLYAYMHDAGVKGEDLAILALTVAVHFPYAPELQQDRPTFARNTGKYVTQALKKGILAKTGIEPYRFGCDIFDRIGTLLMKVSGESRRLKAEQEAMQASIAEPLTSG